MRCAACKTTWHAEKPEDPIDLTFSDGPPRRHVEEDLKEVKAKKLPLKYRAMLEDKKRLKAMAAEGIMWGGIAAAVLLVLLLGYVLRVDIVRAFPRIGGAYAMAGLKVNATNLEFVSYTGEHSVKGGRFVVTVKAQIKNLSDKPTPVPPVRVRLYDATQQQFDSQLIPSGGLVVDPGATRTLVFDVADAKDMSSNLDLDFDLEAMKKMKPVSGAPTLASSVAVASQTATAAIPETQVSDVVAADSDVSGAVSSGTPVAAGSEEATTLSGHPVPALRQDLASGSSHDVASSKPKTVPGA